MENLGKTTNISAVTVSSSVLAELIGVSDRRIRQLGEEGVLIRASKGRYKLLDSLKNYILNLKIAVDSETSQNIDGELVLEEERAIHEKVKRHISELKLSLMKGEMHKAEDIEAVMNDILSSFKTRLINMPSKLSPMLVSRNDVGLIKEILTREVIEVLNELKDYNIQDFYSNDYVEVEDGS